MAKPQDPPNQRSNLDARFEWSALPDDTNHKQWSRIQAAALTFVCDSERKVSHSALKKHIAHRFKTSDRVAQKIISHLVANGELSYTYEYGSSFLQASFYQPLRVGTLMYLLPPGWQKPAPENGISLRVQSGAAFGCGRHPTTRLSLRGIENVFLIYRKHWRAGSRTQALDIGTGSGILAIAALRFGIDRAIGIDRDACARAEAAQNAALNDLGGRFEVIDKPLHHLHPTEPFNLIMANLRYPTLLSLRETMTYLLVPDGALILSGVKRNEKAGILSAYADSGFKCCWSDEEKGWVGMVLRRLKKRR
jgi:ribosomal protein L11 methyltransferase